MKPHILTRTVLLGSSLLLFACQGDNAKLEEEVKALRADIVELKQQLNTVASQVDDIHIIAQASQQPQTKTLPTQNDFNSGGTLPELGDSTATLAIVEFSDYQCPYCKRFIDTTFPKLRANYIDKGKVKYVTRDFPLGFHTKAKGAAVAANCSLKQEAYWPMRTLLFNNMRNLGDELYQQSAQNLSLNMEQFETCLADQQIMQKIERDLSYGSSLGIRGTPSFLIGRIENNQLVSPQLLVGAQSYETFAGILESLENSKTK